MPSVGISRRFFQQVPKDYADWLWAIVREFMQNAIDCGSSTVKMSIALEGGNTRFIVENNGRVMDRDTLEGKLLTLGETTKNENTVGGFGVAKAILYFCHVDFSIHTGGFEARGSGGNYDIFSVENFAGTRNSILIEGDQVEALEKKVYSYALTAQCDVKMIVNGTTYDCKCRKGSFRRDFGFGKVYTNNSFPKRLIVRSNGQPMFIQSISLPKCVILELNDPSKPYLTSNRDGLRSPYSWELTDFIQELAADSTTALRSRESLTYTVFDGETQENVGGRSKDQKGKKKQAEGQDEAPAGSSERAAEEGEFVPTKELAQVLQGERAERARLVAALIRAPERREASVDEIADRPRQMRRVGLDGFQFIIRNESGMKIPEYYLPGSMSEYAEKVARWYRNCIKVAMWLLDVEEEFSTGFVFGDNEGMHEGSSPYGKVFYINPVSIVEQKGSRSRSMKRRLTLGAEGRWAIVALALHEVVHALGHSVHDETYASKLTDAAAIALQERQLFAACFR